ncbi:MAG: alpha/beta family hydrolase [Pseudomonadota bacterium]
MTSAPAPLLHDGPADGPVLLLAHGAGAPMDSDFMTDVAGLLAGFGIHVVRFEFAYMQARRADGKRRPPPRMPGLIEEFRQIISRFPDTAVFIGGKSMGGRVASMIAADPQSGTDIAGLVCLGYPFHPPGKPDSLRTQHLPEIKRPALIVQGERDPFGNRDDVSGYNLPENMQVFWSAFGNHDLAPPKRSGRTVEENRGAAAKAVADFISANA